MKTTKVCLLGGAGYVGHHLAACLARQGVKCRIPTRHPQRHRELALLPGVELVGGDIFAPGFLRDQLSGCVAVVNLVGILNEPRRSRGAGFRRCHVELVQGLLAAARSAGVGRLLHMSALHAHRDAGTSHYLRSKGEGEDEAHLGAATGIRVTSFRPSVIFGPGDGFFNRFAQLLRWSPGILPLACPDARFQPVYVGDVADAFARALEDPHTWGQRYDLCGPRVLSLREVVEYTAALLERPLRVVGLNQTLSRWQARVFDLLPGRPFTLDNLLSLQTDSLCDANDAPRFGIRRRAIEEIVPYYLGVAGQRDRYPGWRRQAR